MQDEGETMGSLEGKVALITGAARGQGRSHALALAREGADIVLTDLAADMETVPYGLGTAEELAETAAAVEALDRRAVVARADVREQDGLDEAVAKGIEELGGIDILVANAGVWSLGPFW